MATQLPSEPSLLAAVAQETRGGPLSRTFFVARVIAIVAAVGGAAPTAMNLYHSWQHGIPFTQVSHRLGQADLWSKNFDCKIDYRALSAAGGMKVDVGACAKSGDISIKISTQEGRSTYEWIAFDQLQKATKTVGLMDLLISSAHAEGALPVTTKASANGSLDVKLAQSSVPAQSTVQVQSSMQVVCQAMVGKTHITRIVNEGGKCYRETVSPFKGTVDKREEVPCNTTCPPAGKA
jgi:hypothetical protein